MTSHGSADALAPTSVLRVSDVDSARFGVTIARAYVTAATDVAAIAERARGTGIAMAIIRSSADDLPVAQAIEEAGGRLCDTLVYYARALDRPIPEQPRPVRHVRPDEVDAITAIAAGAFAGYGGHYHTDPRLDRVAADAGYVDWARRSVTDADMLVIEDAGIVAGFLTMDHRGAETEIMLNAIHPDHQGRGLYTALVIGALHRSAGLKPDRCIVSTQIGNVAPQKVWARTGFEPSHAVHTFHVWFASPH